MTNQFSKKVSDILMQSKEEAQRTDSKDVKPEHLLLGIMKSGTKPIYTLLYDKNVKPEAVRSELERRVMPLTRRDTFEKVADGTNGMDDINTVELSENSTNILRLAVLEARQQHSAQVEPEHLILAILHDSAENGAKRVLAEEGISYDDAMREFQHKTSVTDGLELPDEDYVPDQPNSSQNSQARQDSTATTSQDSAVNSTTPVLDRFSTNLTKAAADGLLDPVVGREREIMRVSEILCRRKKNNPILIGDPGVGKSAIVEGLAQLIAQKRTSPVLFGKRIVSLNMTSIVAGTKYRGQFEERIQTLLGEIEQNPDIIVFIDEIDAVGRQRGTGLGGGHDEREQTLNQLLVEMDGFASNEGVIVLAATNRADILDPALLRPGRFDRQIYVGLPDIKGREEILRVHARNKPLAEDVDLHTVAQATVGFTGADLENLLNEAALISARKNLPVITMQTMEDAVLKVIAGPEKRSLVNIERDRRITAIHEAGHAVAAYFLPTQEPVHQITIVPRGNALGLTISLPDQDTLHTTRNEMRDRIVVLLGGRVAEQLEFDDISTGASNDLQRATKLAHDMIAKYGMNERIGAVAYDDDSEIFVGRDYERTRSYSEQTAAEIDAEVRKTVDQAYAHCTQILTEHHEKLQEIAQWLLEHETMSRSQFEACMQALPIPEKQEGLLAGEEKTDGAEED